VSRTHLKSYPVCYHGQSAVADALELRGKVKLEDAVKIRIEAYHNAVEEMGSDASRWAPATHETADHSLPYVVATALLNGPITYASFAPDKLADARAARLMRMTEVTESAELSARYPVSAPCRLSITTGNGAVVTAHIASPHGHADNPLTEAQVEAKFNMLCGDYFDGAQSRALMAAISSFELCRDVAEIPRLCMRAPAPH
jgi:2-methylcitrate dehydratase